MSDEIGRGWLNKRVRVYSAQDQAKQCHPMAEGEVIAYIDGPSITVRDDGGSQSTWPVSLPIDAWEPPQPTEEDLEFAHPYARRAVNGVLTLSAVRAVIAEAIAESRASARPVPVPPSSTGRPR